jgi:hypothetical protein
MRAIVVCTAIATLWPIARIGAQPSGSTALVVRVTPEAHLNPQRVALHFSVSRDGTSDSAAQPAQVAAWVRALPDQQIRLLASAELSGPDGPLRDVPIRWNGTRAAATGGGAQASCGSGTIATGQAAQDVVSGWRRSGTLTCAMTFSLAAPRALPPGEYSGAVDFTLSAR